MKFKKSKILSGILMAPLMVGGRALICHNGHFIHTSTIVAIHGSGDHFIRFETLNTNYVLLMDPTPQMAAIPAELGLAA